MDGTAYRVSSIQKKLDSNGNIRLIMKGIGLLSVFTVFFCSLSRPETMATAWYLLIPIIVLLFGLDVYYLRQNKKLEFEMYELNREDLQRKKETAELLGEELPEHILNSETEMPSSRIGLPIAYYAVLIVLAVLIRIFMI